MTQTSLPIQLPNEIPSGLSYFNIFKETVRLHLEQGYSIEQADVLAVELERKRSMEIAF